ncbi:MAG: helix-turn-helix domain-containing protein [Ruminococcus sp.]|nr:helix-turn-helix domain-containing protein [Ruminococcus sp.]
MNQNETGALIRSLRLEQGLTQQKLADRIGVTDKAVSKWERGIGCPDPSVLGSLADALGTEVGTLLSGKITPNEKNSGNMKKTLFYVCPCCGNIIVSLSEADISCCGKKLTPLEMHKAEEHEKLTVEIIDNEFYISSDHEMTRNHYISFAALLADETVIIRKRYPEWDFSTRFPRIPYGILVWYCTNHGLMYQYLRNR